MVPLAKILRGVANIIGFSLTAMKNTQGFHAAQAIEEVPLRRASALKVTPVGIGGAHPDQRHEKRDQRGGAQKDQRGGPVNRKNSNNDQQRYAGRQRHLGQVAGIIVVHVVDLLKNQRRPAPRRFTLNPRRACLLEAVENLTADGKADMLPGVKPTRSRSQTTHARSTKISTSSVSGSSRASRNILHYHPMQDPRHEPGLRHDQYDRSPRQAGGNHQASDGDDALLF